MKKDKKPDTLAVINNYNYNDRHKHIHTDRRTWRLYDSENMSTIQTIESPSLYFSGGVTDSPACMVKKNHES